MNRALVACVAVVGALVVTQAVGASVPTNVSGNYTVTDFGEITCSLVGSSTFRVKCEGTGLISEFSGSLVGTSTTDFHQTINCRTGQSHAWGRETFSGFANGFGAGSLTWILHLRSAFDCTTFSESGFQARGSIASGTGDLAHVRGQLRFGEDTYEGHLRA